ncbi:MAG: hypothetical protein IPK66_04025 [Rhodospirillales bacterium]|nr:hypothetical protein [Rhodospirillales bacterium]
MSARPKSEAKGKPASRPAPGRPAPAFAMPAVIQPKAQPPRPVGPPAPAFITPGAVAQATPARPTAAVGGGHRLIIGSYMHRTPGLPAEAAGHTFVAVEAPGGQRQAFGFSPADRNFDARAGLGAARTGVPGRVHPDDQAFAKPGVVTRSYAVSPQQAHAALGKVREYQAHPPQFRFAGQDCGAFATAVLGAAGVPASAGAAHLRPGVVHQRLRAPAVQAKPALAVQCAVRRKKAKKKKGLSWEQFLSDLQGNARKLIYQAHHTWGAESSTSLHSGRIRGLSDPGVLGRAIEQVKAGNATLVSEDGTDFIVSIARNHSQGGPRTFAIHKSPLGQDKGKPIHALFQTGGAHDIGEDNDNWSGSDDD